MKKIVWKNKKWDFVWKKQVLAAVLKSDFCKLTWVAFISNFFDVFFYHLNLVYTSEKRQYRKQQTGSLNLKKTSDFWCRQYVFFCPYWWIKNRKQVHVFNVRGCHTEDRKWSGKKGIVQDQGTVGDFYLERVNIVTLKRSQGQVR